MTLKTNKGVLYIVAMAKLVFERLEGSNIPTSTILSRAKISGGWLIVSTSNNGGGVTFYPDPEHKWDGGSVADKR
jgi:hypothetical protein